MEIKGRILLWAAVLSALPLGVAEGSVIRIDLAGEVVDVDDWSDYLDGKVSVGDPVTGHYKYTTDFTSGYGGAEYQVFWFRSLPFEFSITAGDFEFRTDPQATSFHIAISNDYSSLGDTYSIRSSSNVLVGTDIVVDDLYWLLADDTCAALSSTALPSTPPNLDDFVMNGLRIKFGDEVFTSSFLSVTVTSVTQASDVPEPCTFLLLTIGVALLFKRKSP